MSFKLSKFSYLIFSIKIDDTVSVEVSSANDLSSVYYLLSARGNLISSQTEQVANQKSVVITFPATFAMVPTAQFVAYYISSSGDIIAGRTEISVSGLNNFVRFARSHLPVSVVVSLKYFFGKGNH